MTERSTVSTYPLTEGVHPPLRFPEYGSTRLRTPNTPLRLIPQRLTEITGPLLGEERVGPLDHDLTRQHDGEPQGQRIIVAGRVLDEAGQPVVNTLVEVWQCNAAGRYAHVNDQHAAPLDPNFSGVGRCVTDGVGGYRFITIRPGAYPWRNHPNAWRPAHIHFSLFGRAFAQRLVTQMYFPDDPLLVHDPVRNSITEPSVRERLVCRWSLELTEPEWALGYAWDIVLRGATATPWEDGSSR